MFKQREPVEIGTCGDCKSVGTILNAKITFNGECEHCRGWHEEKLGDRSLVNMELGWCQCGDPEQVDELMLQYLELCAAKKALHQVQQEGGNHDALLLMAYISCDNLQWTEHGGSVNYQWLTPEGEEALENLRGQKLLAKVKP